jgi:predicted amidohydrolase
MTTAPRTVTATDFKVDRYGRALVAKVQTAGIYGPRAMSVHLYPTGAQTCLYASGIPVSTTLAHYGVKSATDLPGFHPGGEMGPTFMDSRPAAFLILSATVITNDSTEVKQARSADLAALPTVAAGDTFFVLGFKISVPDTDITKYGTTTVSVSV